MTLEITYKNGRGHVSINLDQLLPCSAADFERLLSFVNLSEDPADNAAKIHSFISARVQELKNDREANKIKSFKENCTKEIDKLVKNAAKLSKSFNLQEITDESNAEKISFRSATVYRLIGRSGHAEIVQCTGWTFEKAGYHFECFKEGEKKTSYYTVMLSGTGLKLTGHSTRKGAVDMIDECIEALKKNAEKIAQCERTFKLAMIKAGFMEPDPVQEEPEKEEGNAMKPFYTFTSSTITCMDSEYPAQYHVTETGKVIVIATIGRKETGRAEKQRIEFNPGNEFYNAALTAAGGRPENIQDVKENIEPAAVPVPAADPETKERDPKAARGPVPEKTFIGSTISGNGWMIFFDGTLERTRIIFQNAPTAAAKAAVENAGFYYSSKMQSWNKKLTFKAYRAAQKLSGELATIYAA